MATYIYETIPGKKGERVRRFEVVQSMKDKPLTHDPETGKPVRRVITGGYGLMTKASESSLPAYMQKNPGGHAAGDEHGHDDHHHH